MIDEHHSDLSSLMSVLSREEKGVVRGANDEIMSVVRALGGNDRKFRRDRTKAPKADVSEI